jgi:hypothetical protein
MAKILQWLLAATLLTNGAILIYYFFGVSLFLWNADSPSQEELKGTITWNYQYKSLLKEYSLGKFHQKDSLHPNGFVQSYLHLNTATSFYTENNQAFIKKGKDKVFTNNPNNGPGIQLPLSESHYTRLKLLNLFLQLIAITGLLFFILLLYKFSRSAVKGEFFSLYNINRLKWLGSLVLAGYLGLALLNWGLKWYIDTILGYSGINYHISFSLLPYELVSGMVLWVIAAAFQKGLEMQKEQQLTI